MATFPLVSNNSKTSDWEVFKEVRSKPVVRTPFDGGAVQVRVRVTTTRWKFQVGFVKMTAANYDTLTSFFDTNQGGTFSFVHPIKGTSHTVMFSDDELPEAIPIGTGSSARWNIEGINLEETVGSTITVQTTTTTTTTTTTSTSSSTTTTTTAP